MAKLQSIYYQPDHLWKGRKAIKKLVDLSKEEPKDVRQWLSKQAFWQVHSPPPKHVDRPHYEVTVPNEMHQFDLMYMPSDTLYGNKYKYIVSGIDVASRYKVARPLRTKQAHDVAEMITDIYKVGPLTYPKIFQCDNGSEFKGEVTKMLEKHEVEIRRVTTKYKHTHTAFVEDLNKVLAVKPVVTSLTFPVVGKNVYVFDKEAVPFAQTNINVEARCSELVLSKNQFPGRLVNRFIQSDVNLEMRGYPFKVNELGWSHITERQSWLIIKLPRQCQGIPGCAFLRSWSVLPNPLRNH